MMPLAVRQVSDGDIQIIAPPVMSDLIASVQTQCIDLIAAPPRPPADDAAVSHRIGAYPCFQGIAVIASR